MAAGTDTSMTPPAVNDNQSQKVGDASITAKGAAASPLLPGSQRDSSNTEHDDDEAKTEASSDDESEEIATTNRDTTEPESEPMPEHQRREQARSILNAATDTSDDDEDAKNTNNGTTKTNVESEDDDDVIPPAHGEKGVEYTLSELFVNPNLKLKSANVVLKKDPFAIPRATDNVTGYRPRFNPLNILVSEESLLPRNFKFDFSEGIPGLPKPTSQSTGGKKGDKAVRDDAATTTSDGVDHSSVFVRKLAPIRNPQSFGDKLATMGLLMGSMPRQAQASPLINTPTVHNPFGEPLLELVATSEPQAAEPITLQPLRTVGPQTPLSAVAESFDSAEMDLGVDLNGISGLSKLSLVANAASDTSGYTGYTQPSYPRVPPTPPAFDNVVNYLPSHFAEKRFPPAYIGIPPSHYEPGAYHHHPHNHEAMDSFDDGYPPGFMQGDHDDQSYHEYDHQTSNTSSPTRAQQSVQPVAKKSRSKNVFRPCSAQGCTKGARGKSGLCQKHGGGKRCATPNCPKGAQGSSKFCLFHGGGYRCTVPGCTTGARGTSGLCAKHGGYKRARGEIEDGDSAQSFDDGGQAAKNPRLEFEGHVMGEPVS